MGGSKEQKWSRVVGPQGKKRKDQLVQEYYSSLKNNNDNLGESDASKTLYDWWNKTRNSIGESKNGKVEKEDILLNYAAPLSKVTVKEYLINLYKKGQTTGQLKKEIEKWLSQENTKKQ